MNKLSPKLELLGYSKNGVKVVYDPVSSHAATHFEDAPALKGLVKEVLENKVLDQKVLEFETDLGRVVGNTDGVENDKGDEIVWAKRRNRTTYTSFNKTKVPQPSRLVAMGLTRLADGSCELQSAWVGPIDSPPFPGDENETPESKPYWMSHSLVWGSQTIQKGTETTDCPW